MLKLISKTFVLVINFSKLCIRNRKGFDYGCIKGGCGIAVTFNSIISSKYSNFLFITKINA